MFRRFPGSVSVWSFRPWISCLGANRLLMPRIAAMSFSQTIPRPAAASAPHGRTPLHFPKSGFEVIDPGDLVEEERLPLYKREEYYPMHIGDLVLGRYQVVAKLGYGRSSTVWLARYLRDGSFWTFKIHINTLDYSQELVVYEHLAEVEKKKSEQGEENAAAAEDVQPGRQNVRRLHDAFVLDGPHGNHLVFAMTPLGMSLRTFQDLQRTGVFQKQLVASALDQVLLGLYYLHEADIIHTDLHSGNLLIALTSNNVLETIENNELTKPTPRKMVDNGNETTTIHVSQYVLGGAGPLTICDFGQARIGSPQTGPAMPVPYRAPEVLLGMPWGKEVDVWSVGLVAWDLLEKESLFDVYDDQSPENNDAHHLAAMTALMGPPPPEFLAKSEATKKYWDQDGTWIGPVPLPPRRDFASRITSLQGQDKAQFADLMECLLCWLPEQRAETLQAYCHPWLRGTEA